MTQRDEVYRIWAAAEAEAAHQAQAARCRRIEAEWSRLSAEPTADDCRTVSVGIAMLADGLDDTSPLWDPHGIRHTDVWDRLYDPMMRLADRLELAGIDAGPFLERFKQTTDESLSTIRKYLERLIRIDKAHATVAPEKTPATPAAEQPTAGKPARPATEYQRAGWFHVDLRSRLRKAADRDPASSMHIRSRGKGKSREYHVADAKRVWPLERYWPSG